MSTETTQMRFFLEAEENNPGKYLLRLSALFGDAKMSLYFRTGDTALSLRSEALVCLGLLPCLKTGRDLRIDGELSKQFSESLETVQDIYCSWEPSFRRTEIIGATTRAVQPRTGKGVGLLFTGGLDSFYTLLKHKDEITHLIFIHGIDVSLQDKVLRSSVSEMLWRVGRHFDFKVIEIESNLRGFFDSFDLDWGLLASGAAYAAMVHLLSPHFHRIYTGSSLTYAEMLPVGSHRLLDPLWSSEDIEFVHDGCEATRVQKAAKIATSDIALQSLRVCFNNVHSAYNCGKCPKCLRTMINLRAVGALGRCSTFPDRIDIKLIRQQSVFEEYDRTFIRENLRALEGRPEDRELYQALKHIHDRPLWRTKLNQRFWRRVRVWNRSIRRRMGLEKRHVYFPLGGNESDHSA
ncbi:MAG: hypothetical protein OEV08_03665 [Nitrospira sp.]|nr:hypothetical protein [Nitrospira sp.]